MIDRKNLEKELYKVDKKLDVKEVVNKSTSRRVKLSLTTFTTVKRVEKSISLLIAKGGKSILAIVPTSKHHKEYYVKMKKTNVSVDETEEIAQILRVCRKYIIS